MCSNNDTVAAEIVARAYDISMLLRDLSMILDLFLELGVVEI